MACMCICENLRRWSKKCVWVILRHQNEKVSMSFHLFQKLNGQPPLKLFLFRRHTCQLQTYSVQSYPSMFGFPVDATEVSITKRKIEWWCATIISIIWPAAVMGVCGSEGLRFSSLGMAYLCTYLLILHWNPWWCTSLSKTVIDWFWFMQ